MTTLTSYYDMMCNPTSFDIVTHLMFTERERIKRNADDVVIKILPGQNQGFRPSITWPVTVEENRLMLEKVVVPMCTFLPSCKNVEVMRTRPDPEADSFGWGMYSISFKEYVDSYAMGIRPLRVQHKSLREFKRPMITMTLREAEHWPTRNSAVGQWCLAVLRLQKVGFHVVIVRDTAKVDEEINDLSPLFELQENIFREASVDLLTRAALYQEADLNMFVNNGPAWLCAALDAPTIIMRPLTETTCYAHTKEAYIQFGIPYHGQLRNTPPHQRLAWWDDEWQHIVGVAQDFLKVVEYA